MDAERIIGVTADATSCANCSIRREPDGCRDRSLSSRRGSGPDWLLIYRTTEADLILVRTGSHSELFG